MARRYKFYVRVAITISHSFAALTCEILFLPLEHKIHIFSPACNILYYFNLHIWSMLVVFEWLDWSLTECQIMICMWSWTSSTCTGQNIFQERHLNCQHYLVICGKTILETIKFWPAILQDIASPNVFNFFCLYLFTLLQFTACSVS